uniref:Orange domain-containing protein n=1 Tax=Gasterosteus aculeatus aculeatus TaxID=481459 RepID=A0AAQ4RNZ3_GASAC
MPAGTLERTSLTAAAATPAAGKPRALTEHRKSSRHSKLEKADILEMTVKHLRNLQRHRMTAAVNTDPSVLGKYGAGFSECVGEVTRFLSTCDGMNTEVRTRLLGHLASCITQINAVNLSASAPLTPSKSLYGGFQVVPTRDGQFAFLVPGTALLPQNSHAVSPVAPRVTLDPVWRPW